MLAIDVGNTHISCAVFEGDALGAIFRLSTGICIEMQSFWNELPADARVATDSVVVASVRADASAVIVADLQARRGIYPMEVDLDTPMGIENRYETRETLGIDRLINVAAARHLYGVDAKPLVVIDMGTATTIDYLTGTGEYLGGAIAPGLYSAYGGLLANAPGLPQIEMVVPPEVIGCSTCASMRSGVIVGQAAMIREMVALMGRERNEEPLVIVTGGLANVIREILPAGYIFDGDLTLQGLRIIYELNRPGG